MNVPGQIWVTESAMQITDMRGRDETSSWLSVSVCALAITQGPGEGRDAGLPLLEPLGAE